MNISGKPSYTMWHRLVKGTVLQNLIAKNFQRGVVVDSSVSPSVRPLIRRTRSVVLAESLSITQDKLVAKKCLKPMSVDSSISSSFLNGLMVNGISMEVTPATPRTLLNETTTASNTELTLLFKNGHKKAIASSTLHPQKSISCGDLRNQAQENENH